MRSVGANQTRLTWRRIAGYDFKWGHRVIVTPPKLYVTTFGGSVWVSP